MKRLNFKTPIRLTVNANLLVDEGIGYRAVLWFGTMEFVGLGDTPEAALASALASGAQRGFAPEIDAESLKRFHEKLEAQRGEP